MTSNTATMKVPSTSVLFAPSQDMVSHKGCFSSGRQSVLAVSEKSDLSTAQTKDWTQSYLNQMTQSTRLLAIRASFRVNAVDGEFNLPNATHSTPQTPTLRVITSRPKQAEQVALTDLFASFSNTPQNLVSSVSEPMGMLVEIPETSAAPTQETSTPVQARPVFRWSEMTATQPERSYAHLSKSQQRLIEQSETETTSLKTLFTLLKPKKKTNQRLTLTHTVKIRSVDGTMITSSAPETDGPVCDEAFVRQMLWGQQ